MKQFIRPEMEIVEFDADSIITTADSGCPDQSSEMPDDPDDPF